MTGLRPGEKLYEEILTEAEGIQSTKYRKIFVTPAEKHSRSVIARVRRIDARLYRYSEAELKKIVFRLIEG